MAHNNRRPELSGVFIEQKILISVHINQMDVLTGVYCCRKQGKLSIPARLLSPKCVSKWQIRFPPTFPPRVFRSFIGH